MNKKQYEKIKYLIISSILVVFLIQKSFVYLNERKENNEIVFYSLPSTTQSEADNTAAVQDDDEIETREIKEDTEQHIEKININTADSEELQKLKGIGPSIAERIINYRTSYGDYVTIEEIMEVKGIGEKTFEKIKEYICVK